MQLALFENENLKDFRLHKKYKAGILKAKKDLEEELYSQGIEKIFYVLSFGAGTQSTHLFEQHLQNFIDYDYIIFSDTGAEPEFIHDQVEWWRERQKQLGNMTPFIITHHNSMNRGLEEMLWRYIKTDYQRFQLPIYCNQINENGEEFEAGIMPRQCTVDYKIVPVKQAARKLVLRELGRGESQRIPNNVAIIMDIGFSYDEIKRVKFHQSPQYKYVYFSYPLIEENLTTEDSIKFLADNKMPMKRSRCYLCPFNCDSSGVEWSEIIKEEPLSFLKACYFDDKVREVQHSGSKIMKSIPYFHYKRIPLKEAYPTEYKKVSKEFNNELLQWIAMWEVNIRNTSKYLENHNK